MMTDFGKLAAAFALAGTLFLAAAPGSLAQTPGKPPVIALINYTSILQNTKAAKSVQAQLTKQREIYLTEVKKVQTALEKEGKELEQQQNILAKDVREAKAVEFRRKRLEAKRAENGYRRSLDQMQAMGLRVIQEELDKILREIAEKRGIDIVMKAGTPNGMILQARKEYFITDDVIKELDARLPKVTIPPAPQ